MATIRIEGRITCVHHDDTGAIGGGLLNPPGTPYSAIDLKVGRYEMSIIRPHNRRFLWKTKGKEDLAEIVRKGRKLRVTIETIPG